MLHAILSAAALASGAGVTAPAEPQPPPAPPVVTVPTAPSPPPAVDAAALAEARAMLQDMNYEAQLERTAAEAVNRTFDTMMRELQARLGAAPPADLIARVRRVLMEHTARVVADLRPVAPETAARIYARYFTADELRELRRIQTNPVMLKMQRIGPQLLPELMQVGIAASARREPEMQAALRQVFEQWEAEQRERRPHVG